MPISITRTVAPTTIAPKYPTFSAGVVGFHDDSRAYSARHAKAVFFLRTRVHATRRRLRRLQRRLRRSEALQPLL
jgi:hypothetical protein